MPLKALGAIRNEILIWKGKDNKQLTTELSIRRRLDKYLRRALILEERAGKQAKSDRDHGLLTRPPATRRRRGRRPPNIGCGPTKNLEHSRAPCAVVRALCPSAGNHITFLFVFLCSRVLRKYERVRRKFLFPSRIYGDGHVLSLKVFTLEIT